jgi:hypothetical protein
MHGHDYPIGTSLLPKDVVAAIDAKNLPPVSLKESHHFSARHWHGTLSALTTLNH